MKNKEIEELLKYLKNKFYISGEFYTEEKIKVLSKKELELLLSYIEQIENLCNKYEQEHKTTFEIWKKDIKKLEQLENKNKENSLLLIEFQDMEQRIEQLENNRDKAIEYNEHLIEHAKYHLNLGHLKKMRKILKGDSDE